MCSQEFPMWPLAEPDEFSSRLHTMSDLYFYYPLAIVLVFHMGLFSVSVLISPIPMAHNIKMYWIYKACSKKDRTFAIKTLFYNILNTVLFKVVPSTDDTPFPTFLPLLEYFLERTFRDGAQFSYRIFLNLRVFQKRPKFLNSAPTSTEGALQLLSAPSGRFWQQTAICPVSLWALVVELHPLN